MKEELYAYAYPYLKKNMIKHQVVFNKKKNDLWGYVSISFFLLVFSLPMAITKIWLWSIVFVVYVSTLIFNKRDTDSYSKILLYAASSLAYLGIVVSYLIVNASMARFQYSCMKQLILLTVFCIAFYDIGVFINILLKKYTKRLYGQNTYPAIYISIEVFIGGIIGTFISRKLSTHIVDSLWSVWLVVIGCALLFMTAFSLFQKYTLYKILGKKFDK